MDWEPKMPPWDLAEFGRDGEPSQGRQTNPMGCSVDLKLGGSGDSELFNRWKERPGDSTAAMAFPASSSATTASALASSKKPRSLGGGAVCLVDGCPADLSICREYHRRHKVCEVHSKAPVVLVKGQEQRFCQQCSRFHLLVEFDEVKRSCRKRLDGHNRRRRKPQPDPINDPRFFSQQQYHHQGIRFLSPIFPGGAAVPEQKWSPAAMNEEGNAHAAIFVHKHDGALFSSFSRGYYREAAAAAAAEVGIHPLIGAIAATSESKIFSGGFAGGPASDCALSLLSSPVGNPSISDPSGATVVAAAEERTPMGNPLLGASLQQYGLSLFSRSSQGSGHVSPGGLSCASGMEEVEQNGGDAVDVAGGSFHGQGFFHLGVDGAADRAPRGLPFSW